MTKRTDIILAILFCSALLILSAAFVFMPDKDFSEQENRNLAQFPELSVERFFSGAFGNEMNEYFADQFPLRSAFVKIKSGFELAFLKRENNGVIYSYDQLAVKDFEIYQALGKTQKTDCIYPEIIKAQLESVNALDKKLDIPLVTVIPPRTIDVTDSDFSYDRPDGDVAFDIMKETLGDGYIDTLSLLQSKHKNGEYVYYRTDHHWTTLGAYYSYCEIMKQFGKEDDIIPQEEFEKEAVDGFSGSTAAKASFPFYKKDVLEIWHLPDDGDYKVTADGKTLDGLYNRKFLEGSDKYSVFLDGTHNVTEIRKNGEERETLLIAKDSFANSLIPFLAREFDIVAVNLNNITMISALSEQYEADAVLIVYNTENLITTPSLSKIS